MVASSVVLMAFVLCEGLRGVQTLLLPMAVANLHAVFLPFGAVVLLTWVYGWLAVPLMLPAAVLGLGFMAGVQALTPLNVALLTAKVVAVPLSFDLCRHLGLDARGEGRAANWRVLVGVGLVSSVIGNLPRVMVGPCCTGFSPWGRFEAFVTVTAADVAGLLLVLLVAMGLFRVLRQV